MKVELKKEENNIVHMEIEVPKEEAQKAYDKAVRRISENANIPGFRKGKAPKAVIERNFGIDAIKYEALEALLPEVFNEVISENNLDIVTQPSVESYEFEQGKDLKLVAKAEVKPEVTLGDYKNMKLDVEQYKHPEGAFDKSLNSFLERHLAELKPLLLTTSECSTRKIRRKGQLKEGMNGNTTGIDGSDACRSQHYHSLW